MRVGSGKAWLLLHHVRYVMVERRRRCICLRDCPQARRIWRRMGFDVTGHMLAVGDARVWLRELLRDSSPRATTMIWWVG